LSGQIEATSNASQSSLWAKFETATRMRNRVLPTELWHSAACLSVPGYNNNFLIMIDYFIEKYARPRKSTKK